MSRLEPRDIAHRERILLLLGGLFVSLNHISLILVRGENWTSLLAIFVWAVCATAAHLILGRLLPFRDPYIMPLVMLMAGWGITLVARLAPAFAMRQVIWVGVSVVAGLSMAALRPGLRPLRRYRYTWLFVGLGLLGLTLIFGVNPSGSIYAPRLWIGLGSVYFQPSELLKLLLIVFLASYLADKRTIIADTGIKFWRWRLPPLPYAAPMLLMWGICMVLLVWQRDLGAASLFFLIFLVMLYIATGQTGYLLTGFVLLAIAGLSGYVIFDVVKLRVDAWWNPWPDADGRAYQIVQSLLAVAAGGITGEGVGQGAPTFIPVVHSDFVFAAISEEWGIPGGIGVVGCMSLLIFRALKTALLHEEDRPFHALLATGIGVSLGVQSLMIMAGVLKLAPLTGVTLPFVSYGGSSMLSSFVMIGLLLRISDPVSSPFRSVTLLRTKS